MTARTAIATADPPTPAVMPLLEPRRFALLAGEIFLLALLLGCLVVYAATRTPGREPAPATGTAAHAVLLFGQAIVLALAVATASVVPRYVRAWDRSAAMTLGAVVIMYAITAAGFEVLKVAMLQRMPQVISLQPARPRAPLAASAGSAGAAAGTAAPDAAASSSAASVFDLAAGRKAYAASCAGCHGAVGEGLAGVGPALRGSPLIRDNDQRTIAAVIVRGISADAPENKTGKVMPPRGGNPFLSDADVMNIVGFLRGENGDAGAAAAPAPAAGSAAPADGAAPAVAASPDPAASLPRWVVPAPPRPDSTIDSTLIAPAASPGASTGGFGFRVAFGSILLIHVLIGIGLTGAVMWQAYTGALGPLRCGRARFLRLYWFSAIIVWLAQLPALIVG